MEPKRNPDVNPGSQVTTTINTADTVIAAVNRTRIVVENLWELSVILILIYFLNGGLR